MGNVRQHTRLPMCNLVLIGDTVVILRILPLFSAILIAGFDRVHSETGHILPLQSAEIKVVRRCSRFKFVVTAASVIRSMGGAPAPLISSTFVASLGARFCAAFTSTMLFFLCVLVKACREDGIALVD